MILTFEIEGLTYGKDMKLKVFDSEEEVGFFLLIPSSESLYEVHTQIYPKAFGSGVSIALAALHWVFEKHKKVNTLITKVPENNPLAKRLAKKCGFLSCGYIPESFKTDGCFIGQELFYINRGKE